FGALNWSVEEGVRQYSAAIDFLRRGSQPDGPIYVADDGCVCLPGQPWMGTGSRSGCDPGVITSFARLQDTRECELSATAPTLATAIDACPATLLDGTQQPPFTIGFRVPNQTELQPIGTCPLQLAVDQIDATSYDQVPYFIELWATIKNRLIRLHVDIVLG